MAATSAPPSGAAAYKKRDGMLRMPADHACVTWTPKKGEAGGDGEFSIWVKDITNLQQTPANNPKVMLKVLAQPAGGEQQQYVFTFTSGPNARAEADSIRDALSSAISSAKTGPSASATPTPTPTPAGGSTSMPMAQTAAGVSSSSSSSAAPGGLENDQLKKDVDLQQSLLRADPNLQRVFMESLRTKPESVSSAAFVSQFWSSRVHMLRAHAIEKAQTRGAYNVLSSVKPRVEDNVTRLNISKEQIQLIFNQHPLVKRVYDENVPKLSEQQFWSRFFQSRLFKKLRGERVSESDATDSVLDRYLRADEEGVAGPAAGHIPHFIDLEANEDNHSQQYGNRPNFDMRPAPVDKVPVIRTLNSMSEKIMANVAPVDGLSRSNTGAGTGENEDELTYSQLQLRDLQAERQQNRILLNVRDQGRFFGGVDESDTAEAREFARQDPRQILDSLRADLEKTYPDTDKGDSRLDLLVEPPEDEDDSDAEDEPSGSTSKPVGSKQAMGQATSQIFTAIRDRKAQLDADTTASSSQTFGLSTSLYDRVILTHATTTEFLRQFWTPFLSGSPERAGEVVSLAESLNRALDRINAVADEAEAERAAEIEKLKQHAREVKASTGKSIRPNLSGVSGGAEAVRHLLAPTVEAVGRASTEYKKALLEQTGGGDGSGPTAS